MGHHLIPRSIAKKLGISNLSEETSIAWYPDDTTNSADLHKKMHRSLINSGIPYHGSSFTGSVDDFFRMAKEAYKDFNNKGFMKIPYTRDKLFDNMTPLQALEKLEELYKSNNIPKPKCIGA